MDKFLILGDEIGSVYRRLFDCEDKSEEIYSDLYKVLSNVRMGDHDPGSAAIIEDAMIGINNTNERFRQLNAALNFGKSEYDSAEETLYLKSFFTQTFLNNYDFFQRAGIDYQSMNWLQEFAKKTQEGVLPHDGLMIDPSFMALISAGLIGNSSVRDIISKLASNGTIDGGNKGFPTNAGNLNAGDLISEVSAWVEENSDRAPEWLIDKVGEIFGVDLQSAIDITKEVLNGEADYDTLDKFLDTIGIGKAEREIIVNTTEEVLEPDKFSEYLMDNQNHYLEKSIENLGDGNIVEGLKDLGKYTACGLGNIGYLTLKVPFEIVSGGAEVLEPVLDHIGVASPASSIIINTLDEVYNPDSFSQGLMDSYDEHIDLAAKDFLSGDIVGGIGNIGTSALCGLSNIGYLSLKVAGETVVGAAKNVAGWAFDIADSVSSITGKIISIF